MKKKLKDVLKADAEYSEKLHYLHNGLPFLPERIKIGKVKELLAHLKKKLKS